MTTEENRWHCFDDCTGHLYCVQAVGKDYAASLVKQHLGFEYQHTLHFYTAWSLAANLCDKYCLDRAVWAEAIRTAKQENRVYGSFHTTDTAVYIVSVGLQEPAVVSYGPTCAACSDFYPYAVKTVGFKCWSCRNGF